MSSRTRLREAVVGLLFVLASAAGPAKGQIPVSIQEPGDAVLVQRAGLRWIVGKADQHPSGELETVCLTFPVKGGWWGKAGQEPTPDEVRLQEYVRDSIGLRVRACEELEVGHDSRYNDSRYDDLLRDSETGAPAAYLHISAPEILGPKKAEQYVGYTLGGLWGEGFVCAVEKVGNRWIVGDCRRRWQS